MKKLPKMLLKLLVFVMAFSLMHVGIEYMYDHKANAFYYSYKHHESLYKQQKAFFYSVSYGDSGELFDSNVDYVVNHVPSRRTDPPVTALYSDKRTHEIYYYPNFDNPKDPDRALSITIYRDKESKHRLCSFDLDRHFNKITAVKGPNKERVEVYRKEALREYRRIFKVVYDNWEMSQMRPFAIATDIVIIIMGSILWYLWQLLLKHISL